MTESHDTGLLPSELDPLRPRLVETPWGTLALYFVEDRWVAADAWCPHMLGPLHQGTRSGALVVCPWHGWTFDLVSGRRTDDPQLCDPRDRVIGNDAASIAIHATEIGPDGRLLICGPPGTR